MWFSSCFFTSSYLLFSICLVSCTHAYTYTQNEGSFFELIFWYQYRFTLLYHPPHYKNADLLANTSFYSRMMFGTWMGGHMVKRSPCDYYIITKNFIDVIWFAFSRSHVFLVNSRYRTTMRRIIQKLNATSYFLWLASYWCCGSIVKALSIFILVFHDHFPVSHP